MSEQQATQLFSQTHRQKIAVTRNLKYEQDLQCKSDVTMRSVRVTTIVLEKQLRITYSECVL
jgi:hypothetical protein